MTNSATYAFAAVLVLAMAPFAGAQSGAKAEGSEAGAMNLLETAEAAGSFSTLLAAVEAAGLTGNLTGDAELTIFAPTDDAFAALPEGTVEALLEDTETLSKILMHHAVAGKMMAADVLAAPGFMSAFGQELVVDADGPAVSGATISQTDIEASNGVIHVVDSVIVPLTIEQLAEGNDDFTTLVTAVTAAGLVDTLNNDGPFTIFAPTNAAFEKVPADTLASLLEEENKDQLTAVLTYHVVPGTVTAAQVVGLESATTLQGGDLEISVDDSGDEPVVMINDATVVIADIVALNGVVHVIDTVLLP